MSSALFELTRARVKEFLREPEAVFWTFVFPILLSVCLGLAFRETPTETTPVGVVEAAGSSQLTRALGSSPSLKIRALSEAEGRNALRSGKISLLVLPGPQYVLDPTRPESRAARREADDA